MKQLSDLGTSVHLNMTQDVPLTQSNCHSENILSPNVAIDTSLDPIEDDIIPHDGVFWFRSNMAFVWKGQ